MCVCFCEQRTDLDKLFCHDMKNGITDVKCNRASNDRLQQAYTDQERLPKDGQPIDNNDARQRFFFIHFVLRLISYLVLEMTLCC
jgi:hypothetical protein